MKINQVKHFNILPCVFFILDKKKYICIVILDLRVIATQSNEIVYIKLSKLFYGK